jgi:hypothetical protein
VEPQAQEFHLAALVKIPAKNTKVAILSLLAALIGSLGHEPRPVDYRLLSLLSQGFRQMP